MKITIYNFHSSFNSEYIDKAYDILVSLYNNKLNEYKNNLDKYIDECLSKDHVDSILTIKEDLIRKFDVRGLEKEFEKAIQPIFIIPKDGWLRREDYFDHNKYEEILKDFEYSMSHPSV